MSKSSETLLLQSREIGRLLGIRECMDAVESAFSMHARGIALSPKTMGLQAENGVFHIKAGMLNLKRSYFVAKVNANFPQNPKLHGLPTIQGIVVVCDAFDGQILALMDSIEITIIRTGAATGIAIKYLARSDVRVATICGCGNQGKISLEALLQVRSPDKVYAYDITREQTRKFKHQFEKQVEIIPVESHDLPAALQESEVIVTCTPSTAPFIHPKDIKPGTFIAAVGADNEHKQELFPELLVTSKVIVDILEQSATMGELHHAIEHQLTSIDAVHADIGSVIAGIKAGRESNNEIIVFDSTGTALQDVAAATIVYEKAISTGIGGRLNFFEQ